MSSIKKYKDLIKQYASYMKTANYHQMSDYMIKDLHNLESKEFNYSEETARTDLPNYLEPYIRVGHDDTLELIHYGMGMVTEAGEFIDALKKHLMYGRPLDRTNLKEEIGDLLWYIDRACGSLNTTIEAEQKRNIEKLKARFPDKFTEESANVRNLELERQILEK